VANYRCYLIMNFDTEPVCGFSERYDFTASSDDAAQAVCQTIKLARRKFLAEEWTIVAVRLAVVTQAIKGGKCKIFAKRIILCPEIAPGVGQLGHADTPTSAVFADFFYTNVRKPSHRQFRGIPDDWWEDAALTKARDFIGEFCRTLRGIPHVRLVPTTDCSSLGAFPLKCCATRRISERRVGRPFGLLRGRRSKRKVVTP